MKHAAQHHRGEGFIVFARRRYQSSCSENVLVRQAKFRSKVTE